MKIITKVLSSLGLKLNTTKTGYYDDIILSSIKEDKLEWFERKKESNLQKRLISLYKFSLKYKNSGSVTKEISQIREIIEKKKVALLYNRNNIIGELNKNTLELKFTKSNLKFRKISNTPTFIKSDVDDGQLPPEWTY